MDTKYYLEAMREQGYSDFAALPPHEQSRIMRRAQDLKLREQSPEGERNREACEVILRRQ